METSTRLTTQATAYETAFLARYHRWPTTERDLQILPMIYFQYQVYVKKVFRIQHWFRKALQRRRPKTVHRKVQFVGKDQVLYYTPNGTDMPMSEATERRWNNDGARRLEQENGQGADRVELQGVHRDFCGVMQSVNEAKQLVTKIKEAQQLVTTTQVEVASIVVDAQKADDVSVCSSILTFDTPSSKGLARETVTRWSGEHGSRGKGHPSSQSLTRDTNGWHGDVVEDDSDPNESLVMSYVLNEKSTYESPDRPRR